MTRAFKAYKFFVSPFFRVLFGSNFGGCRFYPSCSEYSHDAFKQFGFLRGLCLSISRVLRCNPFFEGGIDDLPKHK